LVISERFLAEEDLEEDHTDGPDIHLLRDLGAVLLKALGCLIPIGANSLACEFYLLIPFVDNFTEAKISYFDLAVVEYYVLGLQVVMDNFLLAVIQVLKATQYLRYYELRLFLRYLAVLLQVEVQVGTTAEFEDGSKAIMVYFDGVELFHDTAMVKFLVDLVLSDCMLYVVVLDLLRPVVVEVVNLAGYFTAAFEVVGLVDLRVTSFA